MFKVKRAASISAAFTVVSLFSPLHPASASPPILDGLTVSLDSRGGSTISGSTWFGQDGTTKNATLQTSTQYDAGNQYITIAPDMAGSPITDRSENSRACLATMLPRQCVIRNQKILVHHIDLERHRLRLPIGLRWIPALRLGLGTIP